MNKNRSLSVGACLGVIVAALGVSACGGGGGSTAGGGTPVSDSPAPSTAPGDTGVGQITKVTQSEPVVVNTSVETGVKTGADDAVSFALTVRNVQGQPVPGAVVRLTDVTNSVKTEDCASGSCVVQTLISALPSTTTVALTVSAPGYQATTINFSSAGTEAAVVGGRQYSGSVTLQLLPEAALSFVMEQDTVYIGDGVPLNKLPTNQFQTRRVGLSYSVNMGPMTQAAQGAYSTLYVSAQIRGLDAATCTGDKITVYQRDAAGNRVHVQSVRLGTVDVADALPHRYTVAVPARGFVQADGDLHVEFASNGALCQGGLEYDDMEFSAVQAWFAD